MSLFMKFVRNVTYRKYPYKALAVNWYDSAPKFYRNIHCTSRLSAKIYLEHENRYAFNILETKGYARKVDFKIESPVVSEDKFTKLVQTDWSNKPCSELLEAFSTFAVYCSKHNMCISNRIFDSYIDCLTDSLRLATDKELEYLFYSLNMWPDPVSIRTRNYIEIWAALDEECLNRNKSWSYDKLLSYVSLFYMVNVARHSEYTTKALNKLASRAKQLTPAQLVQTLFFIGIQRKSPFDMHNLETRLKYIFSEFSIDDLAIIAMGFFKSKTPIRDSGLVLKIIDSTVENSKNVHEVSLAALLKLIRYSTSSCKDNRILKLLDILKYEVPRLSVMCNVHIALLGTTTVQLHEECLTIIAENIMNSLSQTRTKDLERLVLTYGIFNFKPQTKECIFTQIINELRKPERLIEIDTHGRSFACCITYLSLLNFFPEDLINKALNADFLENAYGKYFYNYGREILTLHYITEIFCPDGVINRLSEKAVKILAKKYTDYLPTEEYKKQYNVTERMVLDIIKILKQCRGGSEYVTGDHILPYYQRGDVIICNDLNGCPVAVKDLFPAKDFGLLRRPPNSLNWTVLVIAGRNSMIHGTETPTGPYLNKVRHLEAIGYNATLVPWSIYSTLETDQEKADFVNNLIRNCQKKYKYLSNKNVQ